MEFVNELTTRMNYQESLLKKLKKHARSFNDVPKGSIRAVRKNNCYQYYFKEITDDKYRYLPTEKKWLAKAVSQREYEEDVIRILEKDGKDLSEVLRHYHAPEFDRLFDALPEGKRLLVDPVIITDEMYVRKWLAETAECRNSYPENGLFKTKKGELVRSKSEKIIADMLENRNIPYRYEPEIILANGSKVYPDFAALNVRKRQTYFWEHLGMISDPGYAVKSLEKIHNYEKIGIFPGDPLLITGESTKSPLDIDIVEVLITKYLL